MSEKTLKKNIKKRGEVYWGRLEDAEGYEQQNERPLVIVSNNKQNEIDKLLVAVPLSRSIEKIYPFQVATFFQGEHGKAKCEQVRAITIEVRKINGKGNEFYWRKISNNFSFRRLYRKKD